MPILGPHIYPVEVNYPRSVYVRIRFTAISLDESSAVKTKCDQSQCQSHSGFLIPGAQHVWLVWTLTGFLSVIDRIPQPNQRTFQLQFITVSWKPQFITKAQEKRWRQNHVKALNSRTSSQLLRCFQVKQNIWRMKSQLFVLSWSKAPDRL